MGKGSDANLLFFAELLALSYSSLRRLMLARKNGEKAECWQPELAGAASLLLLPEGGRRIATSILQRSASNFLPPRGNPLGFCRVASAPRVSHPMKRAWLAEWSERRCSSAAGSARRGRRIAISTPCAQSPFGPRGSSKPAAGCFKQKSVAMRLLWQGARSLNAGRA